MIKVERSDFLDNVVASTKSIKLMKKLREASCLQPKHNPYPPLPNAILVKEAIKKPMANMNSNLYLNMKT